MEKKIIKIGSFPNDKTGDKLRDAFIKVNSNFDDLYTLSGLTSDISGLTSDILNKVDKVDGKVLSSNDYTDQEKQKLSELNDIGDLKFVKLYESEYQALDLADEIDDNTMYIRLPDPIIEE
jgi:hypothetical protein